MRLRGSILYEYLFFKHFASSSQTRYLKKEFPRVSFFFPFPFSRLFPFPFDPLEPEDTSIDDGYSSPLLHSGNSRLRMAAVGQPVNDGSLVDLVEDPTVVSLSGCQTV